MKKNIILFVNKMSAASDAIESFKKASKEKIRVAVIRDTRNKNLFPKKKNDLIDIEIEADYSSSEKIAEALLPYHDELLAIMCRNESQLESFSKIIPNVPYLRTPTTESLLWSIDKIKMRKRFRSHDKSITPKFLVVHDAKKKTLSDIEKKVGFPLILKPSGLAGSRLVTLSFHQEELEKNLKKILRSIKKVYKDNGRDSEPQILVEEYMEGEMYSVDAYVSTRGKVHFCPLVKVVTGKDIGREDFYSYKAITPTTLNKNTIEKAEEVARAAVRALGLRNSSAHIELMRTNNGWKIVEVGPRLGGFRSDLYRYAFGIEHGMNDILVRIPKKPVVPKKVKGYACAMKFFPEKEGKLVEMKGIKKIQELKSVKSVKVNKKVGDKSGFAKNGDTSVCNVILFNKERPKLLADIRRIEQTLIIKTK